jgi:hypothetical protein
MFRPLGFLAHKDFNYMAFKYLGFEHLMNAIGLALSVPDECYSWL